MIQEYPPWSSAAIDMGARSMSRPILSVPMTSIDLRCIVLLGSLVAGCATGAPRRASGVPPAPVEEYRATSAAQDAFDRVSDVLSALEVQYTTAAATTDSADRRS